jgi:photosystem II stability/assembly factor-like uncharacterized protein
MWMRRAAVLIVVAAALGPAPPARAALRSWTNRGLYGGAAYIVAAHPSRSGMALAGTSHGVFRTLDGGGSWRRAARSLPRVETVSAISYAPSRPAVAYMAATSGLYRSTDYGDTWSRMHGAAARGPVTVHPVDADVLFAVKDSSLARSDDAGRTWTILRNDRGDPLPGVKVRIPRQDPSLVYAAGFLGGYRSTDGGQSWTSFALPYSNSEDFEIDPQDPDTLLTISSGDIYKSRDRGSTWRLVFEPPPLAATTLHWSAASPDTLYLGTSYPGVYRSRDAGRSWQLLRRGLPRDVVLSVSTGPRGEVYAGLQHRGVYRWPLSQASWRWRSDGITAPYVASITVAPSHGSVVYAGGSYSGVARSTDGGATWRWRGLRDQTVADVAVHPGRAGTVYAAGRHLYRSRDGGRGWRRLLDDPNAGFVTVVVAPSRPSTVYAGSTDHAFRSTDGGSTWRSIRDEGATGLAVHPRRRNILFMATGDGDLLRTRDGGLTWRRTTSGMPPWGVRDVMFDPEDPSTLYAVPWTATGVVRSRDGGRSWRYVHAEQAPEITALAVHPRRPGVVYAGSSSPRGVYRSDDFGRTWVRMSSGLGGLAVSSLALTPSAKVLHAGAGFFGAETGQGLWSYRFRR